MKSSTIKAALMGAGMLAVTLPMLYSVPARAETRSELGALECKTVKGTRLNLIVHSTVDVRCVFNSGNTTEAYVGETGIGLGIDLNIKKDATMVYTVFGVADAKVGTHSLAGKYGGAKASATIGVGLGAAVLVGGDNDNFALQPVALEGSTGLGAEAGLTYLHLEKER